MVRRLPWFCVAAMALSGSVLADGTGALDLNSTEDKKAETREFYEVSRRKVEPDRLPAAVISAAQEAVPGLDVRGAYLVQHRPITYFSVHTEFSVKGRDAEGREVSVRTDKDGSHPTVTRAVPLGTVPATLLAKGESFAAKHGYRLTSALAVIRNERFLGRTSQHTFYYLKGTHPDRPDVEQFVWLCGRGRFGLRDLDDLLWKELQMD